MLKEISEAHQYLADKITGKPTIGIVLGTGLGGLVNKIEIEQSFSYEDIPHFPTSTVESHSGKLIFGKISGKDVVVMQGRFHYYEGYNMDEVVFPIRVMKFLGVKNLLISNAAGGINPDFNKGDLVVIKDHINLFPTNPLIGKNYDELGPRFVDMFQPYNKEWIELAKEIATEHKLKVKSGVYAGLTGPMLETPAEYKYLAVIGADLVGMSTVPEIIAGNHLGMKCFACSIITDECYGEIKPVDISDIIATANGAEPQLTKLFTELIKKI